MGVTIACKKGPDRHAIDMGAGGFLRLRRKVSDLVGEPWASHYRKLTDGSFSDTHSAEWLDAFDKETEELIRRKKIRVRTVDFLMQSDVAGAIRWGACRQLLDTIGDYDDDVLYGYWGRPDCARFRDFRRLLELCVERRCDLVWY